MTMPRPANEGSVRDAVPLATPLLEVHELRVSYGRRVAVDGVSFVVGPREIFGLLGPNGAGKTSILSAIEGLLVPVGGSVHVVGIDVRKRTLDARANLGVQLSREEVDQARDRFKAGVANNIEVIQAQDSLARANDNQIAALYRFNQARADLARSIGQMEKVYAK